MNKEIAAILGIIGAVVGVIVWLQISTVSMTASEMEYRHAPELVGISSYINTDGTSLEELKGNVVLVDFWTYSCINCIRTIPYLNSWYEKYSDDGFTIIGVHTPEFEFEKNHDNVVKAVEKYGIKYPVALDNERSTWGAYQNQYWPRKYLVDINGNIRYDHIGEGAYEETEEMIQKLLVERNGKIETELGAVKPRFNVDYGKIGTPELYLGYSFARAPLGNEEGFKPGEIVDYTLPNAIVPNIVYLNGTWKNNDDHMELVSDNGNVILFYSAKDVNIVAGGDSELRIFIDGKIPDMTNKGSDVTNGKVAVDNERLYNIISDYDYASRLVEIQVKGKGFQIYTFTFG